MLNHVYSKSGKRKFTQRVGWFLARQMDEIKRLAEEQRKAGFFWTTVLRQANVRSLCRKGRRSSKDVNGCIWKEEDEEEANRKRKVHC